MTKPSQINRLQKYQFTGIILLTLFIGVFLLFAILTIKQQKEIVKIGQYRYQNQILANELRQSSEDLTRFARTFVITKDSNYQNQYYKILQIRKNELPRSKNFHPDNRDYETIQDSSDSAAHGLPLTYSALIQNSGLAKEEIKVLRDIEKLSDSLSILEIEAMDLIYSTLNQTGAEIEKTEKKAIDALHNSNYHQRKVQITNELNRFFVLIDERTEQEQKTQVAQLKQMMIWLIAAFFLSIFTSIYLISINSKAKNTIIKSLEHQVLTRTEEYEAQNEEYIQLNEELKQINESLLETQEKISESRQYFINLFNINPDSVTITRLHDGRIVEVNDGFVRLFGHNMEEALGKTTSELNIWNSQDERQRFVHEMQQNGKCENFETILCRKDGTRFNALVATSVIEINKEPHLIGVTRDISQLKKNEQLLRESTARLAESEQKYRNLVDNSMVGVIQSTQSGKIIYSNEAMANFLDFESVDLLLTKNSNELYSDLNIRKEFLEILQKNGKVSSFEVKTQTIKGNVKTGLISATLNNGIIDGTIVEITALKEIEETLRDEQNFINSVMETSPVGIVTIDMEGKITYANSRGVELLGLTKDDIKTMTYNAPEWKITDVDGQPFPESELPFARVKANKAPCYDIQHAIEYLDGKRVILSINAAPLLDINNNFLGMISSLEDITERKNAERKIVKQNIELENLNKSKDKLYSILMHDIRGPLASVHHLSQLMHENLSDYSAQEIQKTIAIFEQVTGQTYDLLENLLEWTRLQQGKTKTNIQSTDLKSLISELIELFVEMAKSKNIRIINNVVNSQFAFCDKNLTNAILRNLISNAIKFNSPGGNITINLQQYGLFQEIEVSDNGEGIDPEKISFLFDFEKNKSTPGTLNEKGTGLGLPLCKEFVEKQGGKIWVESQMGKGTSFKFTLPVNN